MDFEEVVRKRFSIREYEPREVPEKIIREVIDLAKLAPSAGNLQSYKVIVTKKKVTNIEAPLNLIICADLKKSASKYGERGRNLYSIQDATIFAAYVQLALTNAGLGSVWVGAFNENGIKNLLKIPENLKIVAVIPLGYPAGEKSGRHRRNYEEIVSWDE